MSKYTSYIQDQYGQSAQAQQVLELERIADTLVLLNTNVERIAELAIEWFGWSR